MNFVSECWTCSKILILETSSCFAVFPHSDGLQDPAQAVVDWDATAEQPGGTVPSAQLPLTRQIPVSSTYLRLYHIEVHSKICSTLSTRTNGNNCTVRSNIQTKFPIVENQTKWKNKSKLGPNLSSCPLHLSPIQRPFCYPI